MKNTNTNMVNGYMSATHAACVRYDTFMAIHNCDHNENAFDALINEFAFACMNGETNKIELDMQLTIMCEVCEDFGWNKDAFVTTIKEIFETIE